MIIYHSIKIYCLILHQTAIIIKALQADLVKFYMSGGAVLVFLFRWVVIFAMFSQAAMLGFPSGDACADALRELMCEDTFLLDEEDFDEILLCARDPARGHMVRLIAMLGYRLDGIIGSICALAGFIMPFWVLDFFLEWLIRSSPPSERGLFPSILGFACILLTGLFFRQILEPSHTRLPSIHACVFYLPPTAFSVCRIPCSALLLAGYVVHLLVSVRPHAHHQ